MPQLNEYSIEELKGLKEIMFSASLQSFTRLEKIAMWTERVNQAIAERELSDSQLPFRTPKQIEQDEETNNVTFI